MLLAAGVFPFRTHLTSSRLKRGYVEVTVEEACPLFSPGPPARGHVCHTAEILQVTSRAPQKPAEQPDMVRTVMRRSAEKACIPAL